MFQRQRVYTHMYVKKVEKMSLRGRIFVIQVRCHAATVPQMGCKKKIVLQGTTCVKKYMLQMYVNVCVHIHTCVHVHTYIRLDPRENQPIESHSK